MKPGTPVSGGVSRLIRASRSPENPASSLHLSLTTPAHLPGHWRRLNILDACSTTIESRRRRPGKIRRTDQLGSRSQLTASPLRPGLRPGTPSLGKRSVRGTEYRAHSPTAGGSGRPRTPNEEPGRPAPGYGHPCPTLQSLNRSLRSLPAAGAEYSSRRHSRPCSTPLGADPPPSRLPARRCAAFASLGGIPAPGGPPRSPPCSR